MKNRVRLFCQVIPFIALTTSAAAETVGYIPNGGVYLGKGFDLLFPSKVFPLCLKAGGECQTGIKDAIVCLTTNAQAPVQFGETTAFSIKQIHSKSEFFQEVNISASLSASYGPFSGSGSFSSSALDQINQDSLSWMVSAKGYYGSFALRNPEVDRSLSRLSPEQLVARCGQQYVSSIERGVAAVALFTVYNLDEQHKRVIQASMSAGFSTGAFSAAAGATFSSVMQSALQYGSMSINVFTIGGAGDPQLQELVQANPTELDKIKQILKAYVGTQDPARAAIVGFKTTGFGKLINNASIDPDQSNYLYFLNSANGYRLSVLDYLTKVDNLLQRQADFDATTVANAKTYRNRLLCEQQYIDASIQACRLATDLVRRELVTARDSSTRRAAGLALDYGVSDATRGFRACSNAPTGTVQSLGWSRRGINSSVGASRHSIAPTCDDRVKAMQQQFAAMLEGANSGRACIAECAYEANDDLVASVRALPELPFEMTYWYDPGSSSFGGATNPGLYVALKGAANVHEVRFFKDQDESAFGARTTGGAANVVIFVDLTKFTGHSVRVEASTVKGNTYVIALPNIAPL